MERLSDFIAFACSLARVYTFSISYALAVSLIIKDSLSQIKRKLSWRSASLAIIHLASLIQV